MDRRRFLRNAGATATAGIAAACGLAPQGTREAGDASSDPGPPFDPKSWPSVRQQFDIADRPIDLSALYIATHPRPVREAIAEHRRGLDREPTLYLRRHSTERSDATIRAAAGYLGAERDDVALTDSTTMGLGLLYNGLELRPGDDVLTTDHDYYVTHEALRQAAAGSGATVRKIPLYEEIEDASEQEIVGRIVSAIRPETRALALTWVHSSTGLKLPVAEISAAVRSINDERDAPDRVLICVDGVHGLGIEDVTIDDLGCDFFAAGTHKWVFAPRGTGILWGRGEAWARTRPLIPSFLDDDSWDAWGTDEGPAGRPDGERMTPGGFKPYEHRWAMAPAFEFLRAIGKDRIQERTHAMARQAKEGLAGMSGVELVTPVDERLSSGLVCFDVEGWSAESAVDALRDRGIVATAAPYAVSHVRLAPSIRNTPEEVDEALRAVHEIA